MIDGDVEGREPSISDVNAAIQVQYGGNFQSRHTGPVVEWRNVRSDDSPFAFYAAELRGQWAAAEPVTFTEEGH